jgi:hypothetical protein
VFEAVVDARALVIDVYSYYLLVPFEFDEYGEPVGKIPEEQQIKS